MAAGAGDRYRELELRGRGGSAVERDETEVLDRGETGSARRPRAPRQGALAIGEGPSALTRATCTSLATTQAFQSPRRLCLSLAAGDRLRSTQTWGGTARPLGRVIDIFWRQRKRAWSQALMTLLDSPLWAGTTRRSPKAPARAPLRAFHPRGDCEAAARRFPTRSRKCRPFRSSPRR